MSEQPAPPASSATHHGQQEPDREGMPDPETQVAHLSVPELVPIAEFLEQSLPFNELPQQDLYDTVDKIIVQYHCRGDVFNRETEAKGLRIVRSGAVEIRDSDNKLLDRLGEGESFHIGGLNAERGEVQASVFERYRLPQYFQAGYKPYIIAAMMFLSKVKDPAAKLEALVDRALPRV